MWAGDALVALEPQVFDILVYLIENRDRVVSKDDLIASVWGGRIVSESTLTSRINAVRKAIGDTGEKQACIRTFARKGFRFVPPVEVTETPGQVTGVQLGAALALPQKPSIAVLPFSNLGGDAADDSFADGVTEEIITALSRVRWFFVIARGSTFAYKSRSIDPNDIARELGVRYILMGSIRRAGDRIRVTAKLIDGSNGSSVWARSYDRALSDIFAVQDEITQTIVGGIEPELGRAERERARVKHRDSIDAWSTYQRGMIHLYRYTQDDLAEARKQFAAAIAIDPDLGPAYSATAEAYYYEVVYGFAESPDRNRERAIDGGKRMAAAGVVLERHAADVEVAAERGQCPGPVGVVAHRAPVARFAFDHVERSCDALARGERRGDACFRGMARVQGLRHRVHAKSLLQAGGKGGRGGERVGEAPGIQAEGLRRGRRGAEAADGAGVVPVLVVRTPHRRADARGDFISHHYGAKQIPGLC